MTVRALIKTPATAIKAVVRRTFKTSPNTIPKSSENAKVFP
jgi:hypothetical protein